MGGTLWALYVPLLGDGGDDQEPCVCSLGVFRHRHSFD